MPKNANIKLSFMARLNIIASGRLNADTAIIKAKAVPKGMPALRKLKNTGKEEHEQKGVTAPNKDA